MLLPALALALTAVGQGPAEWHEPFPAHKVVGNVYYVGSKDLATYLITTDDGHILINSGFDRTVPLIQKSVESLGFKMTDVKILLASHAHSDHVAGHARLQKLTGAKVFVMRGDDQVIASGGKGQYKYTTDRWDPCKVDRVLEDRDEVKLGGVTLVARLTPGHTRGCTTWTWRVEEGGKKYDVVVIGSPNVNPGFQLVGNKDYPEIADDFAKTFAVLKSLPCDVFLGAHGGYYGMVERHALLGKGQKNPFVNPEGYREYVAQKERAFRKNLAMQQDDAKKATPASSPQVVRIGAVAYAPSAVTVFDNMRRYFAKTDLPIDFVLYSNYDALVEALSKGQVDIAWNTPLAHARYHLASGGKSQTLVMRDVDCNVRCKLLVRTASGITDPAGLQGKTLALGSRDAAEAVVLPLHYLKSDGVKLDKVKFLRLDEELDLRGNPCSSPHHVLKALRDGRADAGIVDERLWNDLTKRKAPEVEGLQAVWTSPAFSHCVFTAAKDFDKGLADRFTRLMLAMDGKDACTGEILRLESARRWVAGSPDGFQTLIETLRADKRAASPRD